MDTTWYAISLDCPRCKAECALLKALYAADGELGYEFFCPPCNCVYKFNAFATALAHRALAMDFIRASLAEPKTGRPAPAPPPQTTPPFLTEEDKQFLRDDHIDPEGGLN